MLAEHPFNDPAIQAQIQADVARIEADWLEWHAEANTGNLDDKIVERLVALLDAHARGYLSAVSTKLQIPEFLTRLRSVGGVLIRTQREHGVLRDPYSEDQLRAIAESSANVIRLRITGPPEEYAVALKSEIERTRVGLRKEAERWVHWSSGVSFRIESHFEARYRHWEAEAIEQVQRRANPLIQNYEFCEAMKQAHATRKIISEASFRRQVVESLRIPENEITPEQWLQARLTMMKEYGAVEFLPGGAALAGAEPLQPLHNSVSIPAEQSISAIANRLEEAVRGAEALTRAAAEPDSAEPRADRRAAVDAFILKCKQETSLNATRTHIWRAVGHSTPRQFQFWQASDPKATAQDDQNFRRILAMSPTDFEALLKKKGII